MIDILNEKLIPLREVLKHLPARPTGRRVHISAVYRWITRGLKGIHLESVKLGGTTYTSQEALQRFADYLTFTSQSHSEPNLSQKMMFSRQKEIDKAAKQVRSIINVIYR